MNYNLRFDNKYLFIQESDINWLDVHYCKLFWICNVLNMQCSEYAMFALNPCPAEPGYILP